MDKESRGHTEVVAKASLSGEEEQSWSAYSLGVKTNRRKSVMDKESRGHAEVVAKASLSGEEEQSWKRIKSGRENEQTYKRNGLRR